MKKIILPFFLLISIISNAQTWEWAKSAGGIDPDDSGQSIATDGNGNVLVTGYFRSPSITFGSNTLINTGLIDIFLVKYDPEGSVLWAKSAGGSSLDEGLGIAVDSSGNVLVTGFFDSYSITFGSTTLINADTTLGSAFFIAKYDANGNVLWAKTAEGFGQGNGVAADNSGNAVVTGYFTSLSITFGADTLTKSAGSSVNIFTVKFDEDGNVLWAKTSDGTVWDAAWGIGIAADSNGNALVTGWLASPTIIFGLDTLINSDNWDIFTLKYDANGNVLWAKNPVGTGPDFGQSISSDISGNILVTGYFGSPSLTFGSTTINTSDVDVFTVKYDAIGNVLWAKGAGGAYGDEGMGIATDGSNNVYVSGFCYGYFITFGPSTLINADNSGVTDDLFILKYDESGNPICAKGASFGTDNDHSLGITKDGNGNVFITGNFASPTITFGSTTLTNANAGSSDIFVAKLGTGTGVNENILSDGIRTFPNPFCEKLSIESKQNPILNVEVYNELGQKTYSLHSGGISDPEQKSPHYELHTQNWPSGFYLLEIKTSQGMFRVKAVKQ